MTAPDPRLAVADGLMGLIVGPEWRKMPSFAGRRDAILAALKAEAERDALKAALEPFGDIDGEGDEDFPDGTVAVVKFGRTTNYTVSLGDFRRARALLSPASEGKP